MPLRLHAITLLVLLAASQFIPAAQHAYRVAAAAAEQRPARPAAFDAAQSTNGARPSPQAFPAENQGWPGPRTAPPEDPLFAGRPAARDGALVISGDRGRDLSPSTRLGGNPAAAPGGVDQGLPRATANGPPRAGTAESSVSASGEAAVGSAETGNRKGSRLLLPAPRGPGSQPPGNLRFGLPLVVTVGGSLALVLGVFFLIAWAVRSAAPHGLTVLPSEVVEVLGRAPLAGRQQLHLLRCGKKLILVSVTPAGAETLTEITDPEEVDRLAGLCQQARPNSATAAFRQVLRQLAGQNKVAGETPGSGLDSTAMAAGRQEDADV